MSERDIDFVLRTVEKRDIRFIRLWFTDVLGRLKSFNISVEDLEEAFEEGVGFDGSSVHGFTDRDESDMLAFPDPTTFQLLPWTKGEKSVARMYCELKTPSREPFVGDSRACLRRVFREAEAKGYVLNVGPKIEYFYFDNDTNPVPLDQAGYFDLTSSDAATDLRRDTTLMLENMSIPVAYSFHSNAPSQNAIELRYTEALSCADNIMTARLVIRQQAFSSNLYASFMPKPLSGVSGSGMFLYQSLFDHEGTNLFWAPKTEHDAHLSKLAQSYIAGILAYAPEFMLITNPTVNSYKRLVDNGEVPLFTSWGRKNRTTLVRIPTHKPGKHQSTRLELRLADPCANPYLTLAATLAAGMAGIDAGLELPPEYTDDPVNMTSAEREAMGIKRLPENLGAAIELFEGSKLMKETLGAHICEYLAAEKKREWKEYSSMVTDWERRTYYAGF